MASSSEGPQSPSISDPQPLVASGHLVACAGSCHWSRMLRPPLLILALFSPSGGGDGDDKSEQVKTELCQALDGHRFLV